MHFYNTRTKKQEELKTRVPGKLGMYVCGPTVYASPHIGNARSVVVYDLLYRLLKQSYEVNYVRNITDVDDKINAAAVERGITIQQLTAEVEEDFNSAMEALGCLKPTQTPHATEHIAEMISIIEKLIANGNAYAEQGHVLFDVATDKNYGHLSRRSVEDMIAGARVEVAPYKRNPADFVLWKPASEKDDVSSKFNSPWGVGRPGWHIECTAMSTKYLGNDFDIHGGGADLTFPHHENEVAQACCANPGTTYANFWLHNGFLTVDGEKMSKSLGNFTTVRELLAKGINGEVIRWALLSSHYRKPLDWTEKLLYDSKNTLDKYYRIYESFPDLVSKDEGFWKTQSKPHYDEIFDEIIEPLSDDLNISRVLAALNHHSINAPSSISQAQTIIAVLKFMGFLSLTPDEYFGRKGDNSEIEKLIELRKAAKSAKNYAEADKIRGQLDALGIVIEDKAGGVVEWRKK